MTLNVTMRSALIGGCMALAASTASAKELRGWNIHVEDYPVSIAMESFADAISTATNGELTAKTFHNGVLGSQPDAIEQLRLGVIDFGEFSLGPFGTSVPEANVVSLPFIFGSIPEMYELMDGAVGDAIGEGMIKRGVVPLGWYDAGARSFYNSVRPINTPEDVTGLKIRVMNNDLFVDMVASMDGNATPMAFAEVYQSIQTGVVDGAENNPPSYESTSHFEVAKYYSLTEHLIIPECLCMSKISWDKLTPEQQDIVMKAGRDSATLQRELWQAREAASMKIVQDGGTIVNEIADKGPFQAAMSPVYDKFLAANPDLGSLVELIRNGG